MDLHEILNGVIEKYGKNEGYAIPEIAWSENNMLSSFGMYQFWNNRIVVSSLQEVQAVEKHDLQLNENEELIFCYLPYDPQNHDSYWSHIGYIDHYNIGLLPICVDWQSVPVSGRGSIGLSAEVQGNMDSESLG